MGEQSCYIGPAKLQEISVKIEGLTRWLAENASYTVEQKHLQEGTTERVYWHYGYLCALRDVLAIADSTSVK
jgi:hypothetical protein